MKKYHLSNSIKFIEIMGQKIIYNNINGFAYMSDKNIEELFEYFKTDKEINSEEESQLKSFIDDGFLVSSNSKLNPIRHTKKKLHEIHILPTLKCNLSCHYCSQVKQNNSGNSFLSKNEVNNFIDSIINTNSLKIDSNIKVRFFGGEPTLNIDVLDMLLETISSSTLSQKYNISYVINTNNVKLSKKLINLYIKYNIYVTISLDGPTEKDNYLRSFKDGTSAFNQIMKNVDILYKNNVNFGFLTVLSKEKTFDYEKMYQLLLKYELKSFGIENIKFTNFDSLDDYKEYASRLLNIYDYFKKLDIRVSGEWCSYLRLFSKRGNGYVRFCGAYGYSIALYPGGKISSCHSINRPLHPSVESFLNYDKYYNASNQLANAECNFCEIQGICNGGCRAEFESIYKNHQCKFNKILFKEILKYAINNNIIKEIM